MGDPNSDPTAIVDNEMKVWEIEKLKVIDA